MPKRTSAFPAEPEKEYEYSSTGAGKRRSAPRRRTRRWVAPFLCVFGFAAAAALSVCALLARADLTVLRDECAELEERIEALANEHDHLVIEHETKYNIASLAAWAEMTPGLERVEEQTPDKTVIDHAEIVPAEDESWGMDKISDAISSVSEYFALPSE